MSSLRLDIDTSRVEAALNSLTKDYLLNMQHLEENYLSQLSQLEAIKPKIDKANRKFHFLQGEIEAHHPIPSDTFKEYFLEITGSFLKEILIHKKRDEEEKRIIDKAKQDVLTYFRHHTKNIARETKAEIAILILLLSQGTKDDNEIRDSISYVLRPRLEIL